MITDKQLFLDSINTMDETNTTLEQVTATLSVLLRCYFNNMPSTQTEQVLFAHSFCQMQNVLSLVESHLSDITEQLWLISENLNSCLVGTSGGGLPSVELASPKL